MNQILSAFMNGLILSVPFAAAVWLILRILPRTVLNAATRYAIWWMTLAIVILLPAVYLPVHFQAAQPSAATPPTIQSVIEPGVDVMSPMLAEPASAPEISQVSRWPQF